MSIRRAEGREGDDVLVVSYKISGLIFLSAWVLIQIAERHAPASDQLNELKPVIA